MKLKFSFLPIILSAPLFFSGCIHEYPYRVAPDRPDIGEDPTKLSASIDVSFDLNWENMAKNIEFTADTKSSERPHRFVIEVKGSNGLECRDEIYLSDAEFSRGAFRHNLTASLKADEYKVGIWYDFSAEGQYGYMAEELGNVAMVSHSTEDSEPMTCGYASDDLSLSLYLGEGSAIVVKEIELKHAGARFEIVATDVQQFISENKDALIQGDIYEAHCMVENHKNTFSVYTGSGYFTGDEIEYRGRMRLPYADYNELKIAEGFIFCDEEEDINMRLWVTDSALLTVTLTESFSFPVKRGYITTVYGNFLTHPVDGIFSINHIWEGEIEMWW